MEPPQNTAKELLDMIDEANAYDDDSDTPMTDPDDDDSGEWHWPFKEWRRTYY